MTIQLGPDGRCCGRKPLKYKRIGGPHYFCDRCSRAYNLETGEWIPNHAWLPNGEPKYPEQEYARQPGPRRARSLPSGGEG